MSRRIFGQEVPTQVIFYFAAVFCSGLAFTFSMLYLNFYLRSLGLGAQWQGLINALPALSAAALSLPAVMLTKRFSNAHTLKIGGVLGVLGLLLMVVAQGPTLALLGVLLQGCGAALTVVAGSPFLANNSNVDNRISLFSWRSALMMGSGFFGNILGGQIPRWYVDIWGGAVDDAAALRAAFVAALLLNLLGVIFLMWLRPVRSLASLSSTEETNIDATSDTSGSSTKIINPAKASSLQVSNWPQMLSLVAQSLIVGLGAGAIIPFLNIFIEGKFNISYQSLGGLFALGSLATAGAILLQPLVVKYVGQLRAVMLVQLTSLPFLVLLGFAPSLWIVTIALMTRGALMNAATPVYDSFAMGQLSEEDRPMLAALTMVLWNMGWAVSSFMSGLLRSALPFETAFNVLFGWTISMYALSVCFLYWRFLRIHHK